MTKAQNTRLTDIDISEMMIVAQEAQQSGFPKVQGNPAHVAEVCRLARIGLQHEGGLVKELVGALESMRLAFDVADGEMPVAHEVKQVAKLKCREVLVKAKAAGLL